MQIYIAGLVGLFVLFLVVQDMAPFRGFFSRIRVGNDSCLYFCTEDDSDMKIAGRENRLSGQDDTAVELKEFERLKNDGSLEKAKSLGTRLAEEIAKIHGESAFGEDPQETAEIRLQRSLLLAFAACFGAETLLPHKLLQKAAVNSLYNTLRETHPRLYRCIRESGAFSFYYLCVRDRDDGDAAARVGDMFAMLCGRKGDPVATEFGRALYLRFGDTVRNIVSGMEFAPI